MSALLLAVIYLIFVSLGLPDSLLGSGWPTMQADFGVPSSYAGYVSMTISLMTIISALLSPRLLRRWHTKWIVIVSIGLTVLGLLGFSVSGRYWMLFLYAVPFGLGAGAIDAAVNTYVAIHYPASVMNFLHCFYGVGAVISPYIMSRALSLARWNEGYRWTAFLQFGILLVCIISLPLWAQHEAQAGAEEIQAGAEEARDNADAAQAGASGLHIENHPYSNAEVMQADTSEPQFDAGLRETLQIPGVVPTLIAFYAYCGGEATCFLWTPSYFAGTKAGLSTETIAAFGSLIFGGLMLGRLIAGFVSGRMGDRERIRAGIGIELIGILLIMLPFPGWLPAAIGFVLTGTGMGPVYPAIQHMAPANFGVRHSASVIGLQMASAYIGSMFMPMIFGQLQQAVGIAVMPYYLLLFALLNLGMLELAYRRLGAG